jgi:hypothetical protein
VVGDDHACIERHVALRRSDLKSGGLLRACVVRTSKIASVDARLTSQTGRLSLADRQAVAVSLRAVLNPVLSV